MEKPAPTTSPSASPRVQTPGALPPRTARRGGTRLFTLRAESPLWQTLAFGLLCLATVGALWWFATRGEAEQRILGPTMLPSPQETFSTFPTLWADRGLFRNTLASLRRVALGFGLAVVVGVPIGVLCGCFSWVGAYFAPVSIFGRNIPIAALIPLTFSFWGIGEKQKILFIFIACVAFIMSDSTRAVRDVESRYVDTAFTLGARRRHVILKVLVPLAMPDIFNSLRLLFGLAFGYIMLAELVKFGGESGGLGDIINMSQRRGPKEHILLVLMLIPVVALAIDRTLFWVQRQLFPHRYGGGGYLHRLMRVLGHGWEDLKSVFWQSRRAAELLAKTGGAGAKP
ncbi:Bicarbonate transport system permease protein CmpB [Phycisphaerae bacterium RAS1]|nr:Bicarbonate transport system permease protein CmpB [Phycisphaerae bacterium RAS1]